MDSQRIDVSVIIVNWNTRDILKKCLCSICEQTKGVIYEIIVIDNASSDDSVAMIKKEYSQVNPIENQDNKGFAAANNQGMQVAKGRYVLLLNSDTVIVGGAIQKAVAFADEHPKAGVIGCRILNPDRSLQHSCFLAPSLLNLMLQTCYLNQLFPSNRFFGRERMTWWDHDQVREVDVVMGAFMLVRREAVEEVGMMDEDYFMYAEETDWCCRFKMGGWQVLFTPGAEIIHLGGQSSMQVKSAMMIQFHRSVLLFFAKHHGPLYSRIGSMLILLYYILRIPFWAIRSLVPFQNENAFHKVKAYCLGIKVVMRNAFNG